MLSFAVGIRSLNALSFINSWGDYEAHIREEQDTNLGKSEHVFEIFFFKIVHLKLIIS